MITTGTRVQVSTGEFGHVTSIDEMASGTTAMVVFEDASVTATGSARIHLDDLTEATPVITKTRKATWLGRAGEAFEIYLQGNNKLGLRWSIRRWSDTGELTASLVKGHGGRKGFRTIAKEQTISEAQLDTIKQGLPLTIKVLCDNCGERHVADHDGGSRFDENLPVYAATCPTDGLTDRYTLDARIR